ncbi:MAG: UDP-N-acetylglucosamine 2-epimerase (non-hydrolyzing) [Alphaproteobacteria bacterium]|nr:UDP-N-acetylglucosamine 2-epimerase (non-hydrolyzing) [Alphaproteobacteria bacterium]
MRILSVVGARPNFMKVAPIIKAFRAYGDIFEQILVHTGQHYDEQLSASFFRDLDLRAPDVNLEVGSGTQAEQTAKVMLGFEPVCRNFAPDLVIVVGDVNSTLACSLTAKKLGIEVAHVEAGLRSGDMAMPEEINRRCVDTIADYLFTTDRLANDNLAGEGIPDSKIHFVGNVMIDTLLMFREQAAELRYHEQLGLKAGEYATLTLHRPSNVDDLATLNRILRTMKCISGNLPIVFPAHPRTKAKIEEFGFASYFESGRIKMIDPLGYLEFLSLNASAQAVFTDSGGLQEETTILGVPCITLRENTERPITISEGTNQLVGSDPNAIFDAFNQAQSKARATPPSPENWDGQAAERIAAHFAGGPPVPMQVRQAS